MPPMGTSRGYGADDNDPQHLQDERTPAADLHNDAAEGHGHGHHDAVNPDDVLPSETTFDDLYITSGGKAVDPGPIGALPPSRILETAVPDPIPYRVDFGRAVVAGIIATLTFTPLWYMLYFGYRDTCYDLGLLLGSCLVPAMDWTARLVGLGIHLGVGAAISVTYAYLLYIFRTQGSGGRGVQFGIFLHMGMVGFVFPLFVGAIARLVPWHPRFDNPDFMLNQSGPSNVGWAPFMIGLLAHMTWGLIVGHLYRHKVVLRQGELPDLAPLSA